MRASTLLSVSIAALASGAPLEERAPSNYFAVSKFVYGCTVTCDWSFDVKVFGKQAEHPPVKKPVTCSGSTTDQDYVKCAEINASQSIYAYIDEDNQLQLQYEYDDTAEGARCQYYGDVHVQAATSGKPQKKNFRVKETSAQCVA